MLRNSISQHRAVMSIWEITAGRTYRFETKTNSGAVDVPDGDADSDYLCKIVTSSGDVDVKQK